MRALTFGLMLLSLASPALAAPCRYTEQDFPDDNSPNYHLDILDNSHMKIGAAICDYFIDHTGGHINCPGEKEELFLFAGKSPHDRGVDLIIRGDGVWYRDPKCK